MEHEISRSVCYVKSSELVDALSRASEWSLTPRAFQALIKDLGWKSQIDLMR